MDKSGDAQNEYRNCPACAEPVRKEAMVCRFCRAALKPVESTESDTSGGAGRYKRFSSSRSRTPGPGLSGQQIGIVAAVIAVIGLFAAGFAIVPGLMKPGNTMTGKWVANPMVNQGGTEDRPPIVSGEWEVDYEYKGEPFIATAVFNQSGTVLTGHGADKDQSQWVVEKGEIQGTRVSFGKRYANSPDPPTAYSGELKFLRSPEYTGWAMEGTYTATAQATQ